MTKPGPSSAGSGGYNPHDHGQQGASTNTFAKPLPKIREEDQKRYSLSDGPVKPSVTSPALDRPIVSYPQPPAPLAQMHQPPPLHHQNTMNSALHPPPIRNHNHTNIGGSAMALFIEPEFAHSPIASMVALQDRPVQKSPTMTRRAKTLRRAAGMTGAAAAAEAAQPGRNEPMPPFVPHSRPAPEDVYPYLLRLVLLSQADDVVPVVTVVSSGTHKDTVKALRVRVKEIIGNKDHTPAYQDPIVKQALIQMEEKSRIKSSNNVEEILITFSIEMATAGPRQAGTTDARMAIMDGLIRDAIQRSPFVGSDAVLQKLDALSKTTSAKPSASFARTEEVTKVIRELFKVPESEKHARMNELRSSSTKQAAIEDLKKCTTNLEFDCFPYSGISDYRHKEHHEEFKVRERSALNGFIRGLSASHAGSASNANAKRNTPYQPNEFTFIPPDPKAFYHTLLDMCVDQSINSRNENDGIASLLPPNTKALLNDCGIRWRLTSSWREILLMDVIKERYRDGRIPLGFLFDFLRAKFYKDNEVNQWHLSEVNMLGAVYGGLNHMIFDNINHDIKDLDTVTLDYFKPMLEILDYVQQQEVFQHLNIDLTPFFEDINETILLEAIRQYNLKDEEVQKEHYENETVPLSKMALYIVSGHGVMKKRFPKPLFGNAIDVSAIVVENNLRNFVPLMQNMANMDARKLPTGDVFPLYQLCRELVSLFEQYAPSSNKNFNISTWFKPYVYKYLEDLEASVTEWVTGAIIQDQFEEVSVGAGHSSSASDLFASFYQPLSWFKGLNWPDDYQRATFFSMLAKVFCKAVDLYAQYMETMFHGCMPSTVTSLATAEAKTLAEQVASFAFRTESAEAKKATQFVFTPKMCVLINNIEAVRQRLDELYRNMDVDEVAQILSEHKPEQETASVPPHQFEIVFVRAERLIPMDTNELSDPFIIMSHEERDVFRSKTIFTSINPKWNEVYEASLTQETSYLIRIYDADKMHRDRLCGWQYLHLNPLDYEDFMSHDMWLDLAQIGRLLLRITMKGERDDIQFFFGGTFRSLKRKEADLSDMIVDAMVPSVQACLTEKILFNNFRSKTMFPFFGNSASSAKVTKVSDEDCDNALGAMIDYLEASLPVLYDYLTTDGMTLVITKLWREILNTIESLLMPPLSTAVSNRNPLTEIETHVVFKIVEFIKLYLNGGDAGDGFPLKVLETPKYKDLLTIRPIYDSTSEELIGEYNRSLTVPGRGRLGRQQSEYGRRAAPRRPGIDSMTPNPETVLRILRMRREDNVEEFLQQAIDTQSKAREARAQQKREQMAFQHQLMKNVEG
ncbi:hypothetical protein BGW38_001926 [Lunasporangiospora selenospora]|uniref:C2 domain-containing protein n=1 Tax=Lunasporangiospora selenospora TaxID=979761 RepID=A0A9P6FSS2_9FUNG|nr:hypothetical protein BGW38_001926 [Lunasporangiospora selenospora]